MHRIATRLFALYCFILATTQGDAAECALPIGSLVLARHPGVHFRVKNADGGELHAGVVARVQKVRGNWLWLGRGWVERRHVVPVWEAVDFFTAEIKRQPTAFAYIARIAAAGRQGAYTTEIKSEIGKALKLDPEFAAGHLLRATRLLSAGEVDDAMDACDDALFFDPRLAEAYVIRGGVWCVSGKPDKAMKDFDRAIRIAPRLASAYLCRSHLLIAKGDYERAIADARESLRHDPWEPKSYLPIGQYWLAKGDEDRAMAAYSEAIRLDPKCGEARLERGRIHSRRGEYYKAMSDLNQAVQLLPKNADALAARGYVYLRLDAPEKSRADRLAVERIRKPSASAQTRSSSNEDKTKSPQTVPVFGESWAEFLKEKVIASNAQTTVDPKTDSANPPAAETKSNPAQQLNNSARRKATSTDERYLDGLMAVDLATEACEKTKWTRADYIDTLAAAYAESGDFDAAIKWQLKAIELAAANLSFKAAAEERLELYRAAKPCREDSPGHLAREPVGESKSR